MLSPRAFTLNKDASEELAPKDVDADANGGGGGIALRKNSRTIEISNISKRFFMVILRIKAVDTKFQLLLSLK